MITRFPGLTPTRSRAVIHDGLVFTVAVSPDGDPSFYEQTRKALKRIDESLAVSGSDKSRILSAVVYIADIARKEEMNKAWDEWLDRTQPPMRACLGVALEPPHLVEIVVTAAELHPAKLPRARRILKFLSMKPEFPDHTL
jgi:enamine deaminase RidA (YjgF/YER057c/UK114 family)